MSSPAAIPTSSIDLFADDQLRDPYPAYAELRALGPLVWLPQCGALAVTAFDPARDVLKDWSTFSSAHGLGLNEAINSLDRDSVLMSDPPRHDVLRGVLVEKLGPVALRARKPAIQQRARDLVAAAVAHTEFDAVHDLARRLPVEVVSDLIGLPQEGREDLLRLADGTFNSFGPDNERARTGMAAWDEQGTLLRRIATRDRLTPGSLGMAVYEAADEGVINPADCLTMLGTYLNAGMDTTVNAIGAVIMLLAAHPRQWRAVQDGEVTPSAAFEEALRFESPVQAFSRVSLQDSDVAGMPVPFGTRVLVLFGSANRDETRWESPDAFAVTRKAQPHLGFGFGIHSCAGQALARIEGEAVVGALVEQVAALELLGTTWHLNNVIRGLDSVSLRVSAR